MLSFLRQLQLQLKPFFERTTKKWFNELTVSGFGILHIFSTPDNNYIFKILGTEMHPPMLTVKFKPNL